MKGKMLTGLIATAIAVACIGTACGAKNSAAPADASSASAVASPAGPAAPPDAQSAGLRAMKNVTVTDPILNMTAYRLSIPAD